MGAEGLEPFPQNIEKQGANTGKDSHARIPGVQVGAIDSDSDSQRQFKQQALDDLQRAWKSIRRMESLSDDPAESKVAGRALALVDRAFEELEGGKR